MSAVGLIAQHILSNLTEKKPLFVSLQGPQGSGKSYLTALLKAYLQSPPHSLRVATFSIDDIYLPHAGLVSLARSHPENVLWQGRGQPGTHDVELGVRVLSALKTGHVAVELPRFEKSLYSGEGDRLPTDGSGTIIEQPPPLDIVIFEGWCIGFGPLSKEKLLDRWNGVWATERERLGLGKEQVGRFIDVEAINEKLPDYLRLWNFFDMSIELKPKIPPSDSVSQYAIVYKWRLEQEHNMKANNGGNGMSDAAVKSFVDRYIPGYVFFSRSGDSEQGSSKGLTVILDEMRSVIETTTF